MRPPNIEEHSHVEVVAAVAAEALAAAARRRQDSRVGGAGREPARVQGLWPTGLRLMAYRPGTMENRPGVGCRVHWEPSGKPRLPYSGIPERCGIGVGLYKG